MTRLAAAIAAGFALCACKPPVSSDPAAKRRATESTAVAAQAGSKQAETGGGVHMGTIKVVITSEHGEVSAALADNDAARALAEMLPLNISMRDHLRQEKTGILPSPLPGSNRERDFSVGTLGLWGDRDFVIYYRKGRVPAPGIVVLGQVQGDVAFFDNAGPVSIALKRAE